MCADVLLLLLFIAQFSTMFVSTVLLHVWCCDDIGRDSWDWVGPPLGREHVQLLGWKLLACGASLDVVVCCCVLVVVCCLFFVLCVVCCVLCVVFLCCVFCGVKMTISFFEEMFFGPRWPGERLGAAHLWVTPLSCFFHFFIFTSEKVFFFFFFVFLSKNISMVSDLP